MQKRMRRVVTGALLLALLAGTLPGRPGSAEAMPDLPAGRYILLLQEQMSSRLPQVAGAVTQLGGKVERTLGLVHGLAVQMTPQVAEQMRTQPGVYAVVPDRQESLPPDLAQALVHETGAHMKSLGARAQVMNGRPADAAGSTPENPEVSPEAVQLTHSDRTWELGVDGGQVKVAIIDSGIDFAHPDLTGTEVTAPDGMALAADFTGTDNQDTIGHGTGVAGMVAAQGRTVYDVGGGGLPDIYTTISGMAPGSRLMAAKVFDSRVPYGGGWDSWIISALDWAVSQGAQIIKRSSGKRTLTPRAWRQRRPPGMSQAGCQPPHAAAPSPARDRLAWRP